MAYLASTYRRSATLVAALLVTCGALATAAPKPKVQPADVVGTYIGQVNPDDPTDVVLVVDPAKNRRVEATLTVLEDGEPVDQVELQGTVAASGNVNLNGKSASGPGKVLLKLRFTHGEPDEMNGTAHIKLPGQRPVQMAAAFDRQ